MPNKIKPTTARNARENDALFAAKFPDKPATRVEFIEQHQAAITAQAVATAAELASADKAREGIAHKVIAQAIDLNAEDFKWYFAELADAYIRETGSDGSYIRQLKSLAAHGQKLTGKARTAYQGKSISAMKEARAGKRAPHHNDGEEKPGKTKPEGGKVEKAVPFDVVLYKAIEQASAHETMHLMGVFLQAARNNGLLPVELVKPMDALTKVLVKLGADK